MIDETQQQTDERFMRMALEEAREAGRRGEVPVGAVIVSSGRVIGRGSNMTETLHDVCAHAEILALTAASEHLGGKYLPDATLYVTLEPCIMCAGALGWSQIGRIVWGASDPKRGYRTFCRSDRTPLHPRTQLQAGVLCDECSEIMKEFFRAKRRPKTPEQ